MANGLPADALLAHAGFVRSVAWHLLRDEADADDAAQETMVKALGRGPAQPEHTRTWLYAVVRSVARRMHRDAGRRDHRERRAARPESTTDPAGLALRAETIRTVADAVACLDEPYRTVVLLRHYDGLPPREISARLGLSVETVKSQLQRAHDRLRERLERSEGSGKGKWRAALAGFAGEDLTPREGSATAPDAAAPVGGRLAMGAAAKWAAAATAALVVAGIGLTVLMPGKGDGGGSTPLPPPRLATSDAVPRNEGLAARPVTLSVAPATVEGTADPRAKSGGTPAGWIEVRTEGLTLYVPSTWSRVAEVPPATAAWFVGTPPDKIETAFQISRNATPRKLLETIEQDVTASVRIDGKRATWHQGKSPADPRGNAVLVTLDDAAPDERPLTLMASSKEAAWGTDEAVFQQVVDSIRFAADAPGRVVEESTDDQPRAGRADLLAGVVAGVVVLGTKPWASATVTLQEIPPRYPGKAPESPPPAWTTVTAEDGSFQFVGLAAGHYIGYVESADLGRRRFGAEVLGDSKPSKPLVIALGRGDVSGHVYDRLGARKANGRVQLASQGRTTGVGTVLFASTDAEGAYHFDHVGPGNWLLQAFLTDDETKEADQRVELVRVGEGESQRVELGSDQPDPLWEGVVRLSSGSPVMGPGSIWASETTKGRPVTLSVDVDGRFSQRLPAGSYRPQLSLRYAPSVALGAVEIGPGGLQRDVSVPGVRVAGVLRDPGTGQVPTLGTGSVWERVGISSERAGALTFDVQPTPGGAFVFDAVGPGTYRVHITSLGPREDGRTWKDVTIEVPRDRDVTGLVLELLPK